METSWLSPGGLTQAKGKGWGQGDTGLGHLFGKVWDIGRMFPDRTRDGEGIVKDVESVLRFLESG